MINRLPLHEEVMLLALRDEIGTISSKAQFYPQIVAGGILSELLLIDAIDISTDKKQLVEVITGTITGNDVLDEALEKINNKSKNMPLKYWLNQIAGISKLKNKVGQSLCEKGVLREEEAKILWVFSSTRFPENDPSVEKALINRLQLAIFSDSDNIDVRTSTLLALLQQSHILEIPFDPDELKRRKQRIEALVSGTMVSDATAEVIKTIQAVIIITAIMPAIVATG